MAELGEQIEQNFPKARAFMIRYRNLLIGGAVALVIFAVLYWALVKNVSYQLLFSDLALEDSARIVDEIEAMGDVAYKLEDGGRTILVDEKRLMDLRLDLAASGNVISGSAGYELFDNQGMMVTDQDRKIMYQRATQGELEKTYRSLEEVSAARVHLTLADDSIYATEPTPASATIVLDLKRGQALDPSQIQAIIALARGAVKNLPQDQVQVLDSEANLLSAQVTSTEPGALGDLVAMGHRQDIVRNYESRISQHVRQLLEVTFGRNKVAVSVLAEIDFDSEERYQVLYDENPVVQSRDESYEADGLGDVISTGPVDENVQNLILESDDGTVDSYDAFTQYEVGRTEVSSVKAVGMLEKLNISVVYDGSLEADMKERMEQIVVSAAGIDPERGDQLNIDGISFDRTYEEAIAEEMEGLRIEEEMRSKILGLPRLVVIYGATALGIIVFGLIFLVVLSQLKRRRQRREELEMLEGLERSVSFDRTDEESGGARLSKTGEQADGQEGQGEDIDLDEDLDLDEINKKDKTIRKYAEENPGEMAELLRSWIEKGNKR